MAPSLEDPLSGSLSVAYKGRLWLVGSDDGALLIKKGGAFFE